MVCPPESNDRIQLSGNSVLQDVKLTIGIGQLLDFTRGFWTEVAERELRCPNVGRSLLKNDGVV